jgi:hypothetical protein
MNMKFLLASLKTLTNSKKMLRKSHQISVPAFLWFHSYIFSSVPYIHIADFRNNFQDHRRVSFGTTQAFIRKLEQAFWRRILEGILQLVSNFRSGKQKPILYIDWAKHCTGWGGLNIALNGCSVASEYVPLWKRTNWFTFRERRHIFCAYFYLAAYRTFIWHKYIKLHSTQAWNF